MAREIKIIISVSEAEKELFQKAADKMPSGMGGPISLSAFIRMGAHRLSVEVLDAEA